MLGDVYVTYGGVGGGRGCFLTARFMLYVGVLPKIEG